MIGSPSKGYDRLECSVTPPLFLRAASPPRIFSRIAGSVAAGIFVASAAVLGTMLADTARAGSDDFDGYSTGGGPVNLVGTGNGEIFYTVTAPPTGLTLGAGDTFAAVVNGGAQSAPNVLQFSDDASAASVGAQLQPTFALDLSPVASTARIEFDFMTTAGPGSRVSMSVKPFYSTDSSGSDQDTIDNTHTTGLADSGIFFLANGGAIGGGGNPYQANTWYTYQLDISRPGGAGGTIDYELEVIRKSDSFSLDQIQYTGATVPPSARNWLTGAGFYLSSNINETILMDNLLIGVPAISNSDPRTWSIDNSGDWDFDTHWIAPSFPNTNETPVIFGSAINSDQTVAVNGSFTAKSIQFDDDDSYFVAGGGTVNLNSNTGTSLVDVDQGSHVFTVDVDLANNTTVDIVTGAQLTFGGDLNLGGQTLTKNGPGHLDINNPATTGTGSINLVAGSLGGVGKVSGNLNNMAGSVEPGNDPKRLSVSGNYDQLSAATLAIELGGTSPLTQYDRLEVTGTAILDGSIDITLIDSFTPAPLDSFTVLTASGGITDLVLNLVGSGSTDFSYQIVSGTDLVLTFQAGDADFDSDGDFDGHDFLTWQRGFGLTSQPDKSTGDANGDGDVDGDDLAVWQIQYGTTVLAVAGASSVPEPSSLLLLLLMAGWCTGFRPWVGRNTCP